MSVCLPRKYGRFMLRIDNNLLLPVEKLHILNTTFRSVFANNSVFNLHFIKVSTENDNNFGYEKITIVVDNMPLTFVKLEFRTSFEKLLNKKAKSIFIYFNASSPDAAACLFVYLANTAVLCYSLTIICCCQLQNYIY
jgi:hypothetical protein